MKKTRISHTITINGKKYDYVLTRNNNESTHVECTGANIDQDFLNEDIPELLMDLPNLIIAEKKHHEASNKTLRFRVSAEEKKAIEKKAIQNGYTSVSGYLREKALSG